MKGLVLTASFLIRSVSSCINISSIYATLSYSLASTRVLNVSTSSNSCPFLIKSNFLLACSSACSTNNLALAVSRRNFKMFSFNFTKAFDKAEEELVRLD